MSTSWDTSDFDAAIDEYIDRLKRNRKPAAVEGALIIMEISQSKTPVESGDLRGSHDIKGTATGAYVYVPGPYARYQHYGLDFHHETGQALYLESAIIEGKDRAIEAMARKLL